MSDPIVAVDVGGTFTDCVSWDGEALTVAKVSTTTDQSEGVLTGAIGLLAGGRANRLLHGSTVATNALLERSGAKTVLVTDAGFEDVIEIGRQDRPSLYDSFADRSPPLVDRSDRVGYSRTTDIAVAVGERNPESIAVSMAYSFADAGSEVAIRERLADLGVPISLSHEVVAEFREFERTSTTVLNAYLNPGVARYLRRLSVEASAVSDRVSMMRSSGGLIDLDVASELSAALLLSGPAGGVVAAAAMGRSHGYGRVITFDMGGTSTDVCRVEGGRPEIAYEREIDGFACRMPTVAVHTVGAGGGSIGWLDDGRSLRVGPRSAGSEPGPACYGRGGSEPTVTDAHVVLGRIDPSAALGDELHVQKVLADRVVASLASDLGIDVAETAAGMLTVVDSHMERAVRAVSVEQGVDPRTAVLVAFGGAGGLHATSLARRLGIEMVAIPPHAGVLSAIGLLMAPPRVDLARSVSVAPESLSGHLAAIGQRSDEIFRQSNGGPPDTRRLAVDVRYLGQSHEISVDVEAGDDWEGAVASFHRRHHEINGFARPDDPVEIVTVRAVAEGTSPITWDDLGLVGEGRRDPRPTQRRVVFDGSTVDAAVWWRPDLGSGFEITGPAIVEEKVGTTALLPGESGVIEEDGTLVVRL